MTTGNTTLLGLALPVEGELDGTWGDVVNDSLTSLVDSAVAGTTTLSADADVTLTDTALAANQARQAVILWTASNGASTRNITAPARSKPYIVINAGTGSIVLRGAGPTTGVTVVAGEKCLAAWNGSDFVKVASSLGTGDVVGPASATTNALAAFDGTTGKLIKNASLTANNVLLGNGTGAPQVVAPGTNGNVLTSNGTTWTSAPLPAGGLTYIFTTTSVTAVDKQGVLTDTSGGAFTVTLPATPSTGAQVVVADAGGVWGTNNLTVARNGSTIGDLAENLTCDINGASVQLVYDGTTWEVYAQIGGNGGTAVTLAGAQTLTNKTIAFADNTLTGVAGTTATQTLTNKTISGADNTLTVDGTVPVGFRTVPQNSQSDAYTLVLADSGKHIFHPSADTTARTFTIPANSSVAYPIGTALTFINQNGAGVVTIAITTDTMRLSPAGTTGSRTLAANGSATCIKVTSTEWLISGSGLT
jgi:hypothetical protein